MTDASPATPQILQAHHLKALKLLTFLREHEKLARQCASDGVDHVRYLLRLAELELIVQFRQPTRFRPSRRFVARAAADWSARARIGCG